MVARLFREERDASKGHIRSWLFTTLINPAFVEKLLGIYRVIHNFTEVGKDGKTPAMRLGLAQAPIDPEEIIYFTR